MSLPLRHRVLTLLSLCFLLLLHVPGYAGAAAEGKKVLKSASELDYPPFSIVKPNGSAGGFSVDLLKAAAEAAGLSVTFKVGPWHELKQELAEGKLDVLPLVSYSEERDRVYDFTAPYIRMNGTVFARKGGADIHSLLDLQGREVLVMEGDTAHEYVVREKLTDKIVPVVSYQEAFRLLSSGRHDAVVVQQIVGLQTIKELNITNVVPVEVRHVSSLKPTALQLEGFEQKFCFAVPEGEQQLLSLLNEGLAVLYVNGTYNELYEKWFSPILPKPAVPLGEVLKQVAVLAIPSLLFLSLLGIWYLKRLVARKTASLQEEVEYRKQSETKLKETQEELERFFQLVPDLVSIATTEGYFVKLNRAWETSLGFAAEELMQEPFLSFVHPDDLEETRREIGRLATGSSSFSFVNRYRTRDGSYRWLEWNAVPMAGKSFLYAVARDITERRLAEQEREMLEKKLQQAQKMEAIGTLAGGIAHDFNNILAAIIGYSEMVHDDCPPGSAARSDIEQVLQAGHRAKDLVRQILAFSRQTEVENISMRPATIVNESLKMLRSSLPATIEMRLDIEEEAGPVVADPGQIHQLVVNLCTNAFQAMEASGGVLSVSLKTATISEIRHGGQLHFESGNYVRLSVEDTGPGIPPEIREKIFDPYFTTKEVGKGTGLGLAIVHGIAKSYNGWVSCRSQMGVGTVFDVYLPVDTGAASSPESAGETAEGGTERILFVDDEEILADMGGSMLSRLGYDVTVTTNAIHALALFQERPSAFDLVITDQTMPGLSGSDLARRLLQLRPDLPVILCTGYSSQITAEKAAAIGIKGFAFKPLAKKDIALLIRKVLAKEDRARQTAPLEGAGPNLVLHKNKGTAVSR